MLRAYVRQHVGRHKHPTAGCFDSQSVTATEYTLHSCPGNVRVTDGLRRVRRPDRKGVGIAVTQVVDTLLQSRRLHLLAGSRRAGM